MLANKFIKLNYNTVIWLASSFAKLKRACVLIDIRSFMRVITHTIESNVFVVDMGFGAMFTKSICKRDATSLEELACLDFELFPLSIRESGFVSVVICVADIDTLPFLVVFVDIYFTL